MVGKDKGRKAWYLALRRGGKSRWALAYMTLGGGASIVLDSGCAVLGAARHVLAARACRPRG